MRFYLTSAISIQFINFVQSSYYSTWMHITTPCNKAYQIFDAVKKYYFHITYPVIQFAALHFCQLSYTKPFSALLVQFINNILTE